MKVGIIGSSVSSMMLCVELAKLGIETSILDSDLHGIGVNIATEHIAMSITEESIKKLSLRCDVMICNKKLDFVIEDKLHAPIYPNQEVLKDICNPKNVNELCEMLEVPKVTTYYFTDRKQVLSKLEEIKGPFKIGFEVHNFMQQRNILEKGDLAEFLIEFGDTATSFMIQPMEAYDYTISCICFVDTKGKIYLYPPMAIRYEEDESCSFMMGSTLTKTMINRLNRYNRKLIKEIGAAGAFTVRYGVKTNKTVELMDITPELGIGSLLTIEGCDQSIFGQYVRLLKDMKIYAPNLEALTYAKIWKSDTIDPEIEGSIYHMDDHYMVIKKEMLPSCTV